jgi:hypothetical protein
MMDNAVGAFLGSACGDAAGGVLEFLNKKISEADVEDALKMPGGGMRGGGITAHMGCTSADMVCHANCSPLPLIPVME